MVIFQLALQRHCCHKVLSQVSSSLEAIILAAMYVRLTQVFAKVLNLKDRSMPWPSCVTVHLLLARLSTCLESKASSEPSENLALVAMSRVAPEDERIQLNLVVRCSVRVVMWPGSIFIMIFRVFVKKSTLIWREYLTLARLLLDDCQELTGIQAYASCMFPRIPTLRSASPRKRDHEIEANNSLAHLIRVAGGRHMFIQLALVT